MEVTLREARADVAEEADRLKVLDAKLSALASFAGVSLSLLAGLGTQLIAANRFRSGIAIALGTLLIVSVSALLCGALLAFSGLVPKPVEELDEKAARERATGAALARDENDAMGRFVATLYCTVLPSARAANDLKPAELDSQH